MSLLQGQWKTFGIALLKQAAFACAFSNNITQRPSGKPQSVAMFN